MFMLGIAFIILIAILVYPFWNTNEGFNDQTKREVKTVFDGTRWTNEELLEFETLIKGAKETLVKYQDDMFVSLKDYQRVMNTMERSAYKQKQGIEDIPKDISKEQRKKIMESSGLSETPVKDFYDPLYRAKMEGYTPIITRTEHDLPRSLPRVSIAPLGSFAKEYGLSWIIRGETKERYDAEEDFYKMVPVFLPEFLASVNEVLQNAKILRQNTGETSWAMRPRMEQMRDRAIEAEKNAKNKDEGFSNSQETCPKSIHIRTIKSIPYKYWGDIAKEIRQKLKQIDELNRSSKQDIAETDRIIEEMKIKGEQGKRKAQNTSKQSDNSWMND
jgi:hypothetical protein